MFEASTMILGNIGAIGLGALLVAFSLVLAGQMHNYNSTSRIFQELRQQSKKGKK